MDKRSILIIEDDPGMHRTYMTILGDEYWLHQVASGRAAEEQLRRHHFCLVIIDGRLLDGRGWEILASLRAKFQPFPPVIAVTGEAGREDMVAWVAAGVEPSQVLVKNGDLYFRLRAAIRALPGFEPTI